MIENLKLKISGEQRHISTRLVRSDNIHQLQQLIIMATGLHSHMDKASQVQTAGTYSRAGFSVLQFNFMGHGKGENKSDGDIKDLTITSSIKDMKTVWDYSRYIPGIDPKNIAISANSYGGLIALLAMEKGMIAPESMSLVAPFSFDGLKPWILPLRLILKLAPNMLPKILGFPVHPPMIRDYLEHHTRGMTKKDLLGTTAVHFFIGSEDRVSSQKDIKRWCKTFNAHTPPSTPFVDNIQAQYTVYEGVPHFKIPPVIQNDIFTKSIAFIRGTRNVRSR